METRANYILIGLFTIAGIISIMGFLLWFARVELDRQFAYYDIRFSSVSGLSNASDVRFSGLPVGQVVDVRLSPERDGTIQVRVEVAADTPVRTDSIASIEAQGVTGVSYVGIGPGSLEAPLLLVATDEQVPEITAGRSTLQMLSEDAPQLLSETLSIVEDLGDLFRGENQDRLERILVNVEAASDDFAGALESFSDVSATVTDFAEQISRFNTTLDTLTGELTVVLVTADTALASISQLSEETRGLVSDGSATLGSFQSTMVEAQRYIEKDLAATTLELRQLMAELRSQSDTLGTDAQSLMSALETTGTTATARLEEAATTLEAVNSLAARLERTAADVRTAVRRIDGLVETEGAPLLSEARALISAGTEAIEAVKGVANVDMPAIVADIRAATETASRVITEVGENLTSASGRVDTIAASAETALGEATTTFRNANDTLEAINAALETGGRTLTAAESAFSSADRVLNEELSGIIASLQETLGKLNSAVDEVAADLPNISDDLRSASQSASVAFDDLRGLAASSTPDIRTFTSTALPLYTRLAQETRELIDNLDRLTQQIERDPARFFLNQNAPEFRR